MAASPLSASTAAGNQPKPVFTAQSDPARPDADLLVDNAAPTAIVSRLQSTATSMRFLTRVMGLLLLAGAFAAAVIDGTRWIANGTWAPTSTGAALEWLSPKAEAAAREFVEGRFGAWAWDELLVKALIAPAFAALTIVSALLFAMSRPRLPEIGRSSRDR
jgi:hypothetical protein